MSEAPVRLDDLITHIKSERPDGDGLDHLAVAFEVSEELGELADHLIGHFVDQARRAGASWTAIGQSMGVSKQAAQKRFVPRPSDADADAMFTGAFSRFTPKARGVVNQAQRLATTAGHGAVGTEHVLIALLGDEDSLGVQAIVAQGAGLGEVRAAAGAALPAPGTGEDGHPAFTAQAKKVRDLTVRTALRLGHNYIGTEHILLALLEEPDGAGGRALREAGVAHDRAEEWITAQLAELVRRREAGA
ncbi:MAG: ATP-dependent Clp protease ATP-binding subunit [Streptosporangiales bacterium]|nr:ATP-dependent Clp protease ATP-binding subunit [Streptosporangiales bacterium]